MIETNVVDPLTAPDRMRAAVAGLIAVESYMLRPDGTMVIEGRLLQDAQEVYRPLRRRAEAIGFTPLLRSTPTGVELVAIPRVFERRRPRIWINLILSILTIMTVVWAGAINELGGVEYSHRLQPRVG